jgi:uncharacterized membrane protein YdbT with pleckstrin-like domain
MEEAKISSVGKRYLKLIELDANEKVVCELRKHPFGLFIVYLTGFLVSIALTLATIFTAIIFNGDPLEVGGAGNSAIVLVVSVVGVLLIILSLIMTAIGAFLYTSNVVFVTTDKIVQVLYTSIFNRKVSQLVLGDVQDITVEQKGLFARIFNFGTLIIETAGEQNNYVFTYAPGPYECSKIISAAHEQNIARFGN